MVDATYIFIQASLRRNHFQFTSLWASMHQNSQDCHYVMAKDISYHLVTIYRHFAIDRSHQVLVIQASMVLLPVTTLS